MPVDAESRKASDRTPSDSLSPFSMLPSDHILIILSTTSVGLGMTSLPDVALSTYIPRIRSTSRPTCSEATSVRSRLRRWRARSA